MGPSLVEIAVQRSLYWSDGTRKKRSRSQPIDKRRHSQRQLLEALVDKYNEDHNLLGDLAYELTDNVCYQSIKVGDSFYYLIKSVKEENSYYYHINFTSKTKGADDDLFFAEVVCMNRLHGELLVSYLGIVKPTDNGYCYGCHNDGGTYMKHPNDAGYIGGHTKHAACLFGQSMMIPWGDSNDDVVDDDDLEAEEARLRYLYQGLDDLYVEERMRTDNVPGKAKGGAGVEETNFL